jgi:hypothetical protein
MLIYEKQRKLLKHEKIGLNKNTILKLIANHCTALLKQ